MSTYNIVRCDDWTEYLSMMWKIEQVSLCLEVISFYNLHCQTNLPKVQSRHRIRFTLLGYVSHLRPRFSFYRVFLSSVYAVRALCALYESLKHINISKTHAYMAQFDKYFWLGRMTQRCFLRIILCSRRHWVTSCNATYRATLAWCRLYRLPAMFWYLQCQLLSVLSIDAESTFGKIIICQRSFIVACQYFHYISSRGAKRNYPRNLLNFTTWQIYKLWPPFDWFMHNFLSITGLLISFLLDILD